MPSLQAVPERYVGWGAGYPPKCHIIQEEVYHPDWKDIPEGVYSPEWNIMQMGLVNKVERIRKSVRILQFG